MMVTSRSKPLSREAKGRNWLKTMSRPGGSRADEHLLKPASISVGCIDRLSRLTRSSNSTTGGKWLAVSRGSYHHGKQQLINQGPTNCPNASGSRREDKIVGIMT